MHFSTASLMKQSTASFLMDLHSRTSVLSFSMLFMAYGELLDFGNKILWTLLNGSDSDRLRKSSAYSLMMMASFYSSTLMTFFFYHERIALSKLMQSVKPYYKNMR